MARPQIKVDEPLLERCIQAGLTVEQIAKVSGLAVRTLQTRYGASLKQRHLHIMAQLSATQLQVAFGYDGRPPNPTMLIWLGKQRLGQRDHNELSLSGSALIPTKLVEESAIGESVAERFGYARKEGGNGNGNGDGHKGNGDGEAHEENEG